MAESHEHRLKMKTRFLIIRFSSMGDIVLTTPVIRALYQQVPGAEIHYVTKPEYEPLLKANPYIHRIHLLHDRIAPLCSNLEKEKIDYIIDLHNNIRSGSMKRRLRVPAYTFSKMNLTKWLYVNFKLNLMPCSHVVDRYMKTLSVFDVRNDHRGLDYFIPAGEAAVDYLLPDFATVGFLAFVIGGTYATKRLPAEKAADICRGLTVPVVLLGGREEESAGDRIAGMAGDHVVNLCGKTSINQSAAILEKSNLVLTNDTGLMHIAAAMQKKIASFWGNTVPGFGMSPYLPDPGSAEFQVEGLKCRPCSKLGFSQCPKGHFRCMNDIDTLKVIQWVNSHYPQL